MTKIERCHVPFPRSMVYTMLGWVNLVFYIIFEKPVTKPGIFQNNENVYPLVRLQNCVLTVEDVYSLLL